MRECVMRDVSVVRSLFSRLTNHALLLTNQSLRDGVGEEAATIREAHAVGIVVNKLLLGEPIQRGCPVGAEGQLVSVVEHVQVQPRFRSEAEEDVFAGQCGAVG